MDDNAVRHPPHQPGGRASSQRQTGSPLVLIFCFEHDLQAAQTQPCDILWYRNILGWAPRWRDFSTWGISGVDDVQSYRVTHSLCRLQGPIQLLHLQLPALLLRQVVGNDDSSHRRYGQDGGVVTRHRSQHTWSDWTHAVHQEGENVLTSTETCCVNLNMMMVTKHLQQRERANVTVMDHCEPGLM